LPDDRLAVTDQGHLDRLVVADLLGRDVELDHFDIQGIARRPRPKCRIQLNLAPIKNTTSEFCNAKVRAAATDSGWSSGITPLPIGERRNGICVRSIKARTWPSASDQATLADGGQRHLGLHIRGRNREYHDDRRKTLPRELEPHKEPR